MSSMSPWTPEAISKLTPVQLLCIGSERPTSSGRAHSYEELMDAATSQPQWTD